MTDVGLTFGVYEITGPTGLRAVINDPADPDFVGYLTGDDAVTGLERAGVRESAENVPENDGGWHGDFAYERLSFTLKGQFAGAAPPFHTPVNKLLAATDAMRGNARLKWTANAVPLMLDFRQQAPTRVAGRIPKTFLITGVAEENTVRSQTEAYVDAVLGAATAGGFSSPLTSPMAGSPGVDGQALATNAGRSRAWPIFEVTGPCVNPVIYNVTTGKRLYLTYTLTAGEKLVIYTDPRRRAVLLGDTTSRYSALDFVRSSWPELAPGLNDLRISFTSYAAGAAFRVRWRDAWG